MSKASRVPFPSGGGDDNEQTKEKALTGPRRQPSAGFLAPTAFGGVWQAGMRVRQRSRSLIHG